MNISWSKLTILTIFSGYFSFLLYKFIKRSYILKFTKSTYLNLHVLITGGSSGIGL